MNRWTERSYKVAKEPGYLDKLYEVFPIALNEGRPIDPSLKRRIVELYNKKDQNSLLKLLISLDTMPISFPFLTLIKKYPDYLDTNPVIKEVIISHLFSMDLDEIIKRIEKPISGTRQIGPMFKTWVRNGGLDLPVFHDPNVFLSSTQDGILDGSDSQLMVFARDHLFYTRDKGLDLVLRYNNHIVICENKFITDFGGAQNNQFNDAMLTAKETRNPYCKSNKIHYTAILDGVVYLNKSGNFYEAFKSNSDLDVLSILVLPEYLMSLEG